MSTSRNLTKREIEEANSMAVLTEFIPTFTYKELLRTYATYYCLFTGNQTGKTNTIVFIFNLRAMSRHPLPKKNILYFECGQRREVEESSERLKTREEKSLIKSQFLEKHRHFDVGATWTVNDIRRGLTHCPQCGSSVVMHRRNCDNLVFRFAGENLPAENQGQATKNGESKVEVAETKNSIYPAVLKWLPSTLIVRPIRSTIKTMAIKDICAGMKWGGEVWNPKLKNIVYEFVSFNQGAQATAGQQRIAVHMDEEPHRAFWDEQIPRVMATDGDIYLTLTPAEGMSWTYDELFERASFYCRTDTICDYLKETSRDKKRPENKERRKGKSGIAVFQAATDDNPKMDADRLDTLFAGIEDKKVIATRRYGIHRQGTSKVFDSFNSGIHVLENYDINDEWLRVIGIDHHTRNNLAIVWVALSLNDEMFIYREWSPDPQEIVTAKVCEEIARLSYYERIDLALIDPIAQTIQPGTGTRVIEDINQSFYRIHKEEHFRKPIRFDVWDTKGMLGRDAVRTRLSNAATVGKPGRNVVYKNGRRVILPTMWFLECCREAITSVQKWRYEEYKNNSIGVSKDPKERPVQKYSHYCTALEGILKDYRFKPRQEYAAVQFGEVKNYFRPEWRR